MFFNVMNESFQNTEYRVVSDRSDDADATVYGGAPTRTVSLKAPVEVAAHSAKGPAAAAKPSRVARRPVTKRTAIQRQLQMQLIEDESWLQRVAELATGVWVEFNEFKGRTYACCVLAAGGNLGEQCLLVPGSGFGVI